MKKAFSYLRVSGLGQVDGDGFERQREAIQKYAEANEIKIVKEFREEGVTGTKGKDFKEVKETLDRPALSEMIEALTANGVKLVIVERADRLARDLVVGELILRELTKIGVKVIDSAGTDLSAADGDPTKVLIRQVLAAVAMYEKTALVLKLRAARQRLKRKGERVEGRKPFGFFEHEKPVVERIKTLKAEKKSLRAIAEVLNGEKVPTREGKAWAAQTVANVLKYNP